LPKRAKRNDPVPAVGPTAPATRDLSGGLAAVTVSAALLGILLAVDPRAESSFDSIKTVVAHAGAVLSTVFLLARGSGPARPLRTGPRPVLASVALAAAGALLAVLSAALAPRPAAAFEALRSASLLALLVPVGASRALDGGRAILPAGAFLAGLSANAAASLLQAAGALSLFDVSRISGRSNTGAFVGNEGYLSLVAALALPVAAGAVAASRGRARLAAGAALALAIATVLANGSLTGLAASAAGALVFLWSGPSRSTRRNTIAAGLVLAAVVPFVPSVRQRLSEVTFQLRTGNADALLSYRSGPWAAAAEMVRERPLLGFGPGAFESRFVPARLAAERRLGRPLATPTGAGSYAEAHSDVLQLPAEIGLPAAGAFAASLALLLAALRRRSGRAEGVEAAVLLAVLAAGLVAALTWFPLQRAVTAAPLLLAIGRAVRLCSRDRTDP
jgi:O-antigen ligase